MEREKILQKAKFIITYFEKSSFRVCERERNRGNVNFHRVQMVKIYYYNKEKKDKIKIEAYIKALLFGIMIALAIIYGGLGTLYIGELVLEYWYYLAAIIIFLLIVLTFIKRRKKIQPQPMIVNQHPANKFYSQ